MDMRAAVAVAKQQINDLFAAADAPQNVRLEAFLYDDHLMVWSLTIGFALSGRAESSELQARSYKIVRVSEANKSVLSISDR
jgi:hypothetical protein